MTTNWTQNAAVHESGAGTGLTTSALQQGLSVVGGPADLISRVSAPALKGNPQWQCADESPSVLIQKSHHVGLARVELERSIVISSFFGAKLRSISVRWNSAVKRVSAHSLTHRRSLGSRYRVR